MFGSKVWLAVMVLDLLRSVEGMATSGRLRITGPQAINFWRLQKPLRARDQAPSLLIQPGNKAGTEYSAEFPAYYFEQPLDHFSDSSETFGQRYWLSTRHYTPGFPGPVIVAKPVEKIDCLSLTPGRIFLIALGDLV